MLLKGFNVLNFQICLRNVFHIGILHKILHDLIHGLAFSVHL